MQLTIFAHYLGITFLYLIEEGPVNMSSYQNGLPGVAFDSQILNIEENLRQSHWINSPITFALKL